ncbi:MAG TPA: hypothetical protein VII91_10390 [Bauldia sp.]
MNLLWIAGLTILIFVEKIVPAGRLVPRISGGLLGAAGVWLPSARYTDLRVAFST